MDAVQKLSAIAALIKAVDVEDFKSTLSRLLQDGADGEALVAHDDRALPRLLAAHKEGTWLQVLFDSGLMDQRAMVAALGALAHWDRYDLFREVFSRLPEGFDTRELISGLSYFNDTHDLRQRIEMMTDLGLLSLQDTEAPMTEALMSCVATQKSIEGLKLLVSHGYPAGGRGSFPLRMSAWYSEDPLDAAFFIERGARVEDRGFNAIRGALSCEHYPVVNYLLTQTAALFDDIKVLVGYHTDGPDWDHFEEWRQSLSVA